MISMMSILFKICCIVSLDINIERIKTDGKFNVYNEKAQEEKNQIV